MRRVREAEAAKHGFQVKAILETAKKRQQRAGHKGRMSKFESARVSFQPKKKVSA